MNGQQKQGEQQDDSLMWLTSRVVYVEKGSERISLGNQAVTYFTRNAFIAVFSVNLKYLQRINNIEGWVKQRLNGFQVSLPYHQESSLKVNESLAAPKWRLERHLERPRQWSQYRCRQCCDYLGPVPHKRPAIKNQIKSQFNGMSKMHKICFNFFSCFCRCDIHFLSDSFFSDINWKEFSYIVTLLLSSLVSQSFWSENSQRWIKVYLAGGRQSWATFFESRKKK